MGLPRSVHGKGEHHGLIARLIAVAREKGVASYVGDGPSRWHAVHVLDAAHLFRLAVERTPAGSVLHAVGDIAAAIGRHVNVPTASVPADDFGFLGAIFGLDQPASSALTSAARVAINPPRTARRSRAGPLLPHPLRLIGRISGGAPTSEPPQETEQAGDVWCFAEDNSIASAPSA